VAQEHSAGVTILNPSPELLLGLLAVLYAGGAYLPVSPSTPADRAAFADTVAAVY
jgi:non-ribosomal peptide synthetase component F